ncbi:uncharacterized protein CDAR_537561, partial [Caerostris darwini]
IPDKIPEKIPDKIPEEVSVEIPIDSNHNDSRLSYKKTPVPLTREIVLENATQSLDMNRHHGIESVGHHDVFDMETSVFGYRTGYVNGDVQDVNHPCTSDHYIQYFEAILDCQDIRMKTLMYFEGTRCNYNWMERSLESFAKCLLESRNKLHCKINDVYQVNNYLETLGEMLNRSRSFQGERCPAVKPCYGSGLPPLFRCADIVYSQLNSSVNGYTSLSKNGLSTTMDCLGTAWPHCNPNVSPLAVLSIYAPLGVGLENVLKENGNEKCFLAEIKTADTECTYVQRLSATQEIFNCMDRTTIRIGENLNSTTEKLHWQVLPLTVCVMMHPILECKQSEHFEFKEFMVNLLEGIRMRLLIFLKLFDDPMDIMQGRKCTDQFLSASADKCLSHMFGFMNSFHKGLAKISDYPSHCVEETFKECGDIDTFHLLMKKSMNLSDVDRSNEVSVPTGEVCLKTERYGLYSCVLEDFERSFSSSRNCPRIQEIDGKETSFHTILKVCKNCILKDVGEMCFYDLPDFSEAVSLTFAPLQDCLQRLSVKDKCIDDLTYKIKDNCLSTFQLYVTNIRQGTVLKAAQLANEFYDCLKVTVKNCPKDAHEMIFNFYSSISGVEIISKFRENISYI